MNMYVHLCAPDAYDATPLAIGLETMLRGYAISTLGELAACLVNAGINRDDLVEWINCNDCRQDA